MAKFQYKVYDSKFNIIKGELEEKSLDIAAEKLKMQGLTVIEIKKKIDINNLSIFKKKIKSEEIADFCGQMGMIISAGLNIINGVEIIKEQNKKLRHPMDKVLKVLNSGETLGTGMEECGYFPKLLTDMIKSGEISGNVEKVLFNMEEYYKREANLENKIKNASIYPSIVIFVVICMTIFFNYFVFTSLGQIYKDQDNLPSITKVFLTMMNFVNNNFIAIIISIIVIIAIFNYLRKISKVKYYIDFYLLKIPVLGRLNKDIITDRFTRSMAIFTKSGVPILVSIETIEKIIGNEYISQKIQAVRHEVSIGNPIADSLEKYKIFDLIVYQMVRVGEQTGQLEEMLDKLSLIYDKKIEGGLTKTIALIEPLFTLIIGVVVAFVVIAMALPILQMSNNIK